MMAAKEPKEPRPSFPTIEDGDSIWVRLPRDMVSGAVDSAEAARGKALAAVSSQASAEALPQLNQGRYVGHDGLKARIELRVTLEAVSGDIFRGPIANETWVGSFRTATDETLTLDTELHVLAVGRQNERAGGSIVLSAVNDRAFGLELTLGTRLDGLPLNQPVRARMQQDGSDLRRLGLEIETETGVSPAAGIEHGGQTLHLRKIFARAGIGLEESGEASDLPAAPQDGWSEKQLHTLMAEFAQTDLTRAELCLRLLWLSKSNRSGLLGVMFDDQDALPRQGCAVFADEIRRLSAGDNRDRKLLQIAVHEIGHALNLAHRFDTEIGQRDSLSVMNYDWKYRGGGRASEFWELFDFAFDADEIGFLQHGPHGALVPGGDAFLSAAYWKQGSYGYPDFNAESESAGLALRLIPPIGGSVFHFAQPVILGIQLRNMSAQEMTVPVGLPDPKAGGLDVVITREQGRTSEPQAFHPITHRCIDHTQVAMKTLKPGEVIESNLNLSFGTSGFPFAEPGNYRVEAALKVDGELSAACDRIRIRISSPQTRRDERLALDLLEDRVGRCLVLGGSGAYSKEVDRLMEIAEGLKAKSGMARDPIAINIFRSLGFHYSRSYPRLQGRALVFDSADAGYANHCAAPLDRVSLKIFDPVTARNTENYLNSLGSQ